VKSYSWVSGCWYSRSYCWSLSQPGRRPQGWAESPLFPIDGPFAVRPTGGWFRSPCAGSWSNFTAQTVIGRSSWRSRSVTLNRNSESKRHMRPSIGIQRTTARNSQRTRQSLSASNKTSLRVILWSAETYEKAFFRRGIPRLVWVQLVSPDWKRPVENFPGLYVFLSLDFSAFLRFVGLHS